ncbi:DUF1700 domain-containing protein [Rhizobium laguerreae]|uniref:DUF1700 domain-containing protein n=1 Tax=Rhizobium laguerreae TaxID=1076926 RepID=UPI001C8FB835|nr:DUF1700 domain-containing protein [Rhizobium laguerreae]MBY3469592.1 DUF1700 domain-containing protein [Rhizobium laguerreae]MBY3517748.1 DUF1700 domain-containing protein [Rhizobium laguerreae]UFW62537.1 DUF1700 domain-containing protein [Rhizobium laguerreae]
MTKDAFLNTLRRGLRGLPGEEIEEIMSDYSSHFAESESRGRSEAEVVSALGEPARIARELLADIGLRRFEKHWSLSNLIAAAMALAGLAIVDLLFLLPLLLLAILLAVGFAAGLLAIGAAGLNVIVTALLFHPGDALMALLARLCIGAGFVSGFLGGGALLLMGLGVGISVLGQYARLHFRLVRPDRLGN